MASDPAFLGRGWAWPVALGADGEIALSDGPDNIAQSIRLILMTNLGERVMRSDFGTTLRRSVFAPIDTTSLATMRLAVERALIEWEPRIDTITVQLEARPSMGRVDIGVRYRIRATNSFYNLVYPFYVREALS